MMQVCCVACPCEEKVFYGSPRRHYLQALLQAATVMERSAVRHLPHDRRDRYYENLFHGVVLPDCSRQEENDFEEDKPALKRRARGERAERAVDVLGPRDDAPSEHDSDTSLIRGLAEFMEEFEVEQMLENPQEDARDASPLCLDRVGSIVRVGSLLRVGGLERVVLHLLNDHSLKLVIYPLLARRCRISWSLRAMQVCLLGNQLYLLLKVLCCLCHSMQHSCVTMMLLWHRLMSSLSQHMAM